MRLYRLHELMWNGWRGEGSVDGFEIYASGWRRRGVQGRRGPRTSRGSWTSSLSFIGDVAYCGSETCDVPRPAQAAPTAALLSADRSALLLAIGGASLVSNCVECLLCGLHTSLQLPVYSRPEESLPMRKPDRRRYHRSDLMVSLSRLSCRSEMEAILPPSITRCLHLKHVCVTAPQAPRDARDSPSSTRRPPSRTTMRSAMRTVEKRCEIKSAILPKVSSANRSKIPARASLRASSEAVGSSRIRSCASRR